MSTAEKTETPRSIEQIEQQLAELARLKRQAEAYGSRDFASRVALDSLRQHEQELAAELQAARSQAFGDCTATSRDGK